MSEEDKQPFLSAAARDRERYKREMAVYKPARDVNKPKRPGTAFMLFMADFRKEMAGKEPEGGVAALAKLGGERWRGMTEDDKRPYVERQNEEKMKYETNMEEYRRKVGTLPFCALPLLLLGASVGADWRRISGALVMRVFFFFPRQNCLLGHTFKIKKVDLTLVSKLCG
ncbi:hypothetical protein HPB48_021744 [Haemaphysalis longicornis]|uniref:HMG box domain-containing protein n=1 Tax=Haemaphysalis longicornis TaxID=44386 RepID=A0A9J6H4J6_HAELO|nr:hypothetical protein HPB48_021744 [Haemaphysalis longicornis]